MPYRQLILKFLLTISLCGPSICMALVDPTMPADQQETFTSGSMDLSAIMIWKDRRLAVINGKIVHVGDSFNNARIIKIESNTVEMEGAEGRFTLQLLTYPLKRVK